MAYPVVPPNDRPIDQIKVVIVHLPKLPISNAGLVKLNAAYSKTNVARNSEKKFRGMFRIDGAVQKQAR